MPRFSIEQTACTLKTNNAHNLLIVGKIPPPIGGVTIHVRRLLDHFYANDISPDFIELSLKSILSVVKSMLLQKYRLIHLHASSPVLRLSLAFVARFLFCNLAITYHGNLGRFKLLKNMADIASVFLADVPVVLNKQSHDIARKINAKTILAPGFIPPISSEILSGGIKDELAALSDEFDIIFCTNASNVKIDKNGNEIYGITNLIHIFKELKGYCLVVSDPSGSYYDFLEQKGYSHIPNIIFITEAHPFIEIIKFSDCVLRATTTDGDSLSVKEALFYSKQVVASDCVSRPVGVILYKSCDWDDLAKKIIMVSEKKVGLQQYNRPADLLSGYDVLMEKLYSQYI